MKTLIVVLGMMVALNLGAQTAAERIEKSKKMQAAGKHAEAIEVLKTAVAQAKNNIEKSSAQLHLADSYIAINEHIKAEPVLKEVAGMDDIGIYLKGSGLCKLGQVYRVLKKYPEAEESFNQAKKLFTEPYFPAEAGLGDIYFDQEKYEEALKQYQIVAKISNVDKYNKAAAVINQGRVYMKMNQPEKAKEMFQQVVNSAEYDKIHKDYAAQLLKQIK